MFGLGMGEMLLLAAIALIAIGPKQLPEVARTFGRFMNEMKRATGNLTRDFTDVRDQARQTLNDSRQTVTDVFSGVTAEYQPPVHTPEQEAMAAAAASDAADAAEAEKQGSLFVPTNFADVREEQLEFQLTSFDDLHADDFHVETHSTAHKNKEET